jgi:hypothetical protein
MEGVFALLDLVVAATDRKSSPVVREIARIVCGFLVVFGATALVLTYA